MLQKILVVEDTPSNAEFLKSFLEMQGFIVVLAWGGLEALEHMKSTSPDLLITDLAMPGMSGVDLIKRIRARPEYARLPILAITSFEPELAITALKAGASRALTRPMRNQMLHNAVTDLLAPKANSASD
jgi:CheY-like chemotaxis protein